TRSPLQHHSADGLSIRRLQISLGQLHLLGEIIVGEFFLGEEFVQHIEIISGVQGQKAQLQKQSHSSVLDAAEEVGQVAVEVVVNLHTSLLNGTIEGYGATATKHVDKPGKMWGSQAMDQPEQL